MLVVIQNCTDVCNAKRRNFVLGSWHDWELYILILINVIVNTGVRSSVELQCMAPLDTSLDAEAATICLNKVYITLHFTSD